jgi:rRNA-processing protein FCF1
MFIVCDTDFLSSFLKIDSLDLVKRLFKEENLHIPRAVLLELAKTNRGCKRGVRVCQESSVNFRNYSIKINPLWRIYFYSLQEGVQPYYETL